MNRYLPFCVAVLLVAGCSSGTGATRSHPQPAQPDASQSDAGAPDAAPPDTTPADTGPDVSGNPDANPPDAGSPDTNPPDTGADVGSDTGDAGDVADTGDTNTPPSLPSHVFSQTSGGGLCASAGYQVRVSVGAPQPYGYTSNQQYQVFVGPLPH